MARSSARFTPGSAAMWPARFLVIALASPERSAEAAVKSVDFGSSSVPAIARLASHFDTAWTRSNVKMPPPRALTTSRPLLKGASVW